MAAHPQLSTEDAAEMVKYILSLADAKPKVKSLPSKERTRRKLHAGDKGQGVYIFRAAYKDRGANGLPGVSSEESFTLRSPSINPTNYDEIVDVNKMSFGGNKFIIPTKSGGYVGLKNVDLTGITQMEFTAVAPKAQLNAAGGLIEIRMDSPTGKLIGKSDFIGDGGFGSKPVVVNLESVAGFHNLYLVFTNPDVKQGGSLMVVMNTVFKSESVSSESKVAPRAPTDLNAYVGKYKMTGLPFEFILVSVADGKLMLDAGGQIGELTPTTTPDTFDAGGKAILTFQKGDKNIYSKLKMDAMGFSFEGAKE